MKNPVLLVVFVLAIFSFVVFNIVSRVFYKNRHKDDYHFYNMFPYEFNYPSVFKENPYGNFLFIFSGFAISIFYILNPYTESIYRTISIIVSIAFAMVLICLILMPLYYLKTHMVLSISSMLLAMVLPLFNMFLALNQRKTGLLNQTQDIFAVISIVVSALLSFTMLLLILNPKLSFKIYYEKAIDADGKEIMKRPKIIYLAFTEWMSIFIYFLSPIGLLLISII